MFLRRVCVNVCVCVALQVYFQTCHRQREEKLREQRQKQEERMRKYDERIRTDPKKKVRQLFDINPPTVYRL